MTEVKPFKMFAPGLRVIVLNLYCCSIIFIQPNMALYLLLCFVLRFLNILCHILKIVHIEVYMHSSIVI